MFWKTPKINTDDVLIQKILTRGTEDVFVKENLYKRLKSGKQLRVKLGFDPTGSKIHIGNAVTLRKMREFQNLGHKIAFIVGDFTARIGDPSDKLSKRPMLNKKDVVQNLKDYKKQVGKIIDLSKAEFHFNSTWLSKLTFDKIAELAESFTVQQMSNRRNFKERIDKGEEVSLREFLYPLMQGYDSVMVKSDVEIGGFDQLFNVKAGRVIQKYFGQTEQDVLTTKMLSGTDGRKMSKSWGNVINVTDEPNDMFGKVMSVKDELLSEYFLLCTDTEEGYIEKMKKEIAAGANPRDFKLKLAEDITMIYHGKDKALKAKNDFINTFKKGGVPNDIETIVLSESKLLVDVLLGAQIVSSKSEWRRLVEEGAVSFLTSQKKIRDPYVFAEEGDLKVGKRRFVRIKIV